VLAKPLDEYIREATKYQQSGDLAQAVSVMEAAATEYPDNPNVYAYLGFYKGMQAGATQNFMEAGRLSSESFALLDKGVALDSLNVTARFYRGLMGVKVPEFLGRLDGAIRDLELVVIMQEDFPEMVSAETIVSTYELLGEAYHKKGESEKAMAAWRQVIARAPDSDAARSAEEAIAKVSAAPKAQVEAPVAARAGGSRAQPEESTDITALMQQAESSIDKGDYVAAEKVLRQVISIDSANARAYKMLGSVLAFSDRGYDERIAKDTTLRTNLAFEAMKHLDKAVSLAPDDIEARLMRGIMGVSFPFFVGKLDQGLEDLQAVVNSNAPAPMKAQARYWLGFGYQKKGMSFWTQIVNDNPDQETVRMALSGMRPRVEHFDRSKYPGSIVVVDFVLGFRDELEPQTAVWVETEQGEFVRTLYVSGFSGHARGVQIVLPEYAKTSKFADADAVTGASIDLGHHIYVWDLKDSSGRTAKPGEYVIKVETTYWPSMKYQLTSATIGIGTQEDRKVVEEGDYIPYLEARYLP
jgi:tetratricopeptide (TPR) repeat protein